MYNDKTKQKGYMKCLANGILPPPQSEMILLFIREKKSIKKWQHKTHSSSRRELTFQQVIEVLEFYKNEQLSPSNWND